MTKTIETNVTVVGLGYVGLPLAIKLAETFHTTGLDIDVVRVEELKQFVDRTGEICRDRLASTTLALTSNASDCPPSEFYIVTVPTPIDADKKPDLSIVEAASRTVGAMLPRAHEADLCPVVVYESTVYPGVTETLCADILEEVSGLTCGKDFKLAYSPERINPGDREHTVDKITKVVSGQDEQTLARAAELYEQVTSGGVYRAASIRAAEAAKVIENAQRDINIAFMNEVTLIFESMGISIWDVLAAAKTKWNFLPFTPGLVGGHCIGVDPYYLTHIAEQQGVDPRVVGSGRKVNDEMADWVAKALDRQLQVAEAEILMLGLTFKEDVPDLRNSKVADVFSSLTAMGHCVTVFDPLALTEEAEAEYGIKIAPTAFDKKYDMVFLAVPHAEFVKMGAEGLRTLLREGGVLADLKGVLENSDWSL